MVLESCGLCGTGLALRGLHGRYLHEKQFLFYIRSTGKRSGESALLFRSVKCARLAETVVSGMRIEGGERHVPSYSSQS
jgi:hypothetical protein